MATGFPFVDRRQRPCVMGLAAASGHPARQVQTDTGSAAPTQHRIDPARASARGRSYVDIASVPGGPNRPHRDVLG